MRPRAEFEAPPEYPYYEPDHPEPNPPDYAPDDPTGNRLPPLVEKYLKEFRARAQARDLFNTERQTDAEPFDLDTLAAVLSRPAPPRARVAGLIPWESSTLITAQRKTGKTTLTLNLARSLLTGEDFLGAFDVQAIGGAVAFMNYEVSGHQLARWAADVDVPADRLILVNLRGRRNPLSDPTDRDALAQLLKDRHIETLIVDPFGRAYSGKSQNDASEVAPWLVALDRFKVDVGARDLILTAHAGWNGERTRGSSALEDWADSIWTLTRDDNDECSGERYLRAIGRDVDLEEDRLDYDHTTRRLTLSGSGNRRTAAKSRRQDDLIRAVIQIATDRPGLSGNQIAQALKEAAIPHQKGEHTKALSAAVDRGLLAYENGPRQAKLYRPTPLTPTYPEHTPGVGSRLTPTSPIGSGVGQDQLGASDLPPTCQACQQPMTNLGDGATTHPACTPRQAGR